MPDVTHYERRRVLDTRAIETAVTCKQAVLVAAESALSRGNVAKHLRLLKMASRLP